MRASRYTPVILAYCRANGIDVPPSFERHPASQFAVVRTDSSPPRLSAKTFFEKEDLHYYIRSRMQELDASDATALPLQVLDFKENLFLTLTPDGRTQPGQPFLEARPEGSAT